MQDPLFADDFPATRRGSRLPRADRVLGGGHHLPAAGLLGAHRAGDADGARRVGLGTQRLYSFGDILVLKIVKRLLETGVSLQNIRTAVNHLRSRGADDLASITLMSDGTRVYECTSADEVIDLVQGGQGVFGIAVGRVVREVEGSLSQFPGERADDEPGGEQPSDELATRRRRRTTA
jgi:DNA-binding transcriptional MerR regulator